MTYLIENEQAALVVPARFLGRVHPDDREIVQLLAVQVADDARHVAFGLAHVEQAVRDDPATLRSCASRSSAATAALASTAGLGQGVFDALVVLAAGEWKRLRSSGATRA